MLKPRGRKYSWAHKLYGMQTFLSRDSALFVWGESIWAMGSWKVNLWNASESIRLGKKGQSHEIESFNLPEASRRYQIEYQRREIFTATHEKAIKITYHQQSIPTWVVCDMCKLKVGVRKFFFGVYFFLFAAKSEAAQKYNQGQGMSKKRGMNLHIYAKAVGNEYTRGCSTFQYNKEERERIFTFPFHGNRRPLTSSLKPLKRPGNFIPNFSPAALKMQMAPLRTRGPLS